MRARECPGTNAGARAHGMSGGRRDESNNVRFRAGTPQRVDDVKYLQHRKAAAAQARHRAPVSRACSGAWIRRLARPTVQSFGKSRPQHARIGRGTAKHVPEVAPYAASQNAYSGCVGLISSFTRPAFSSQKACATMCRDIACMSR